MSSSLPLVVVGRELGQRDTMLGNIKLGENKIFDAEEIKRFLLESPLPPPQKKTVLVVFTDCRQNCGYIMMVDNSVFIWFECEEG